MLRYGGHSTADGADPGVVRMGLAVADGMWPAQGLLLQRVVGSDTVHERRTRMTDTLAEESMYVVGD